MYKKIFPILFIALLLQSSCAKDPDTVGRTDVYSSLNYPTTLPALFAVLTPAYGNIRSAELHGFELMCKDFAGSEHVAELAYGGDISWTELTVNNMNTNNSYANNLWVGLYRGIKITNTFLDRADFYEQQYASPTEKNQVTQMRGEAHFLRALYYFYLECFYGERYIGAGGANRDKKGVPLIKEMAGSLDATQVPRNTTGETWDFIVSELQLAAEQLKGVQWSGNNTGRATEWSAKALLGKAYVFTENWAAARTVLADVINNSGKKLMPFSKYSNAFNGIDANEFNEESLFEINVDRNSMGGYGIFDFPATALTTSQGLIWSPCILGDDGTEARGLGLGYCNEFFNDKNLARFGFKQPIYQLVENPAFDKLKDPSYPNNIEMILSAADRQQSVAARVNKTVDPRLYVAAMQPWIDSASNDGATWRPVSKYIAISNDLKPSYYGWSLKKFVTYDNTIFNRQAAADAANYYLLRLADVYLLYAEANMNAGGDIAVAKDYINMVKRRAYGYPIDAASPVDYQTLTSATMATDPNLANNPLRYERWAELFGEGHWWFDVCRWRIGSGEAAYYATSLVGGPIKWSDAKSYTWPIPSNEINTNTKMEQNPGY